MHDDIFFTGIESPSVAIARQHAPSPYAGSADAAPVTHGIGTTETTGTGKAMRWMIDTEFFSERIVQKCLKPWTPRDPSGDKRIVILQLLLCASVNGHSWRDPSDLAMRIGRPSGQCERVWQLCIEENVLRPVPGGYSAIEWLRERGYFRDGWKRQYTGTQANQGKYEPPSRSFMGLFDKK